MGSTEAKHRLGFHQRPQGLKLNTQFSILKRFASDVQEKLSKGHFCGSDLDTRSFHNLVKGSLFKPHILGNHPYFPVTVTNTKTENPTGLYLPTQDSLTQHQIHRRPSSRPGAPAPLALFMMFFAGSKIWDSSPRSAP